MNKEDFKIFNNYKKENNSELVYLDNAASSLTPDIVVEKISEFYYNYKSNLDRGLYKSAIKTKEGFDSARQSLATFIGVDIDEIIFTSGSTDSANKLALLLESNLDLKENDEILTTVLEHHSSLLPLQELAHRKNLKIEYLDLSDLKNIEESLSKKINENTKIVNITHVSNVTGEILDIKNIVKIIKSINKDIFVISDLTAAVGHSEINASDLQIDAGYFSLHKMFGPSGVGVLFIKRELSRKLKPIFFGGGMVFEVGRQESSYRSDVRVFEAGTNNLADIIASRLAVEYTNKIGLDTIKSHNEKLVIYALKSIKDNFGDKIEIFCEQDVSRNSGIISFNIKGVHPHDVAEILGKNNIAIRSGHHCAKLLLDEFGVTSLCRISFYIYNDEKDIDALVEALKKVFTIFKL